ncbi:hypothetical protein K3495_g8521 [Podosphaera aphanis]|nr:hypothetical protein K3495_g8521 [Podosphaera aphanis]
MLNAKEHISSLNPNNLANAEPLGEEQSEEGAYTLNEEDDRNLRPAE